MIRGVREPRFDCNFNMRYQISRTYETTNEIIVIYRHIIALKLLGRKEKMEDSEPHETNEELYTCRSTQCFRWNAETRWEISCVP
jgi:hypothetical protein